MVMEYGQQYLRTYSDRGIDLLILGFKGLVENEQFYSKQIEYITKLERCVAERQRRKNDKNNL